MATQEDVARIEGSIRVEVASVRLEVAGVRTELATKPSRGSMWGMAIALVALVVASIGTVAGHLPMVSRALR